MTHIYSNVHMNEAQNIDFQYRERGAVLYLYYIMYANANTDIFARYA